MTFTDVTLKKGVGHISLLTLRGPQSHVGQTSLLKSTHDKIYNKKTLKLETVCVCV